MLSIFFSYLSNPFTVYMRFIQLIITGIHLRVSPISIEINLTLQCVDSNNMPAHPWSGSNGIFQIPISVIMIIMSPTRTLRTEQNIFSVIQHFYTACMYITIRFIYFVNQFFDL